MQLEKRNVHRPLCLLLFVPLEHLVGKGRIAQHISRTDNPSVGADVVNDAILERVMRGVEKRDWSVRQELGGCVLAGRMHGRHDDIGSLLREKVGPLMDLMEWGLIQWNSKRRSVVGKDECQERGEEDEREREGEHQARGFPVGGEERRFQGGEGEEGSG